MMNSEIRYVLGPGKMNMDGFMDLMATQIRANASDKNVDSLSAQTIQFLLDSFRMFDQDKDGYLNEAEIKVLNFKLKLRIGQKHR